MCRAARVSETATQTGGALPRQTEFRLVQSPKRANDSRIRLKADHGNRANKTDRTRIFNTRLPKPTELKKLLGFVSLSLAEAAVTRLTIYKRGRIPNDTLSISHLIGRVKGFFVKFSKKIAFRLFCGVELSLLLYVVRTRCAEL